MTQDRKEENDVRASEASAASDDEAAFEAWAYGYAETLPSWWPDGERGQQAARFLSAALKCAWANGFLDERERYEESAWRHSGARDWALRCQVEAAKAAAAVDPHVSDPLVPSTRGK